MSEPARPLNLPDRENTRAWPVEGEWTYEDYRQLPDDGRRYEVIRGRLHVSPAPSYEHQLSVNELSWQLNRFVREHDLGQVLSSPFDVLLPGGLTSPVQPDLMFFCKGNQPRHGDASFRGIPDLLVEVLSPSTRRLDTRVKLAVYRDAGVPEVWHADPGPRTLTVYVLSEEGTSYVELSHGGPGESVVSRVLPGLRIEVSGVFPGSR